MIGDTTFIIDLIDGLPAAVEKLRLLQEQRKPLFVTTPTIFELWTGVTLSDRPEREKAKAKQVLESQFILDLNQKSAEEAGVINGTLISEGQRIDPEDCLIAGIAKHHGETILTRNTKNFERIKGVNVEGY